jgi:hypothetical protein
MGSDATVHSSISELSMSAVGSDSDLGARNSEGRVTSMNGLFHASHSLEAEKTDFGTNPPLESFRCPRRLGSEPGFTAS